MSNSTTDIEARRCVIAIAKEGDRLKAVELRKQNETLEVVWARCSKSGDMEWKRFAAELGLSVEPAGQAEARKDRMLVLGFDSGGMAFYRISVPVVGKEELAAIVRLQAETLLPLPAEQMELAWRAGQTRNGQVDITLAAARREQLQGFVEKVWGLKPTKILLDCEAIVKAWRTVFSGHEETAVVVSAGTQTTQVCLARKGQLRDAVVLDVGIEDFAAGGTDQQTETTERFAQDMRSVLELFGCGQSEQMAVFVLSDGGADYVNIVSSLRLAGFDARIALPEVKTLKASSQSGVDVIHEYRVAIGLGLMALGARENELNIFERLYSPATGKLKRRWLYSPRVAAAIATVMLVLLVVVCYAVDVVSPDAIEERLRASSSDVDMNLLMQRQRVLKTVAVQRPDLLELLSKVNKSGDRGIKLESFHFKKGQPVTITGQASGNDQLYRFEENLQKTKGIEKISWTATANTGGTAAASGGTDARVGRGRGFTFTMTFHYKNFTR